jgi:O-antigen/teichoic acid export membrane protein
MLALSGLAIGAILAVILLLVQLGLMPWLSAPLSPGAVAIFAIVGACTLALLPAAVVHRVMSARQEILLSNVWQSGAALGSIACCLLAIALEAPTWLAVAAYSLPPVLSADAANVWYLRRHPALAPRAADVTRGTSRDLLGIGSRFFALTLILAVALNVDNPIIAARIGAGAVTDYTIPVRLGGLMALLVFAIFTPLCTSNGEALARGEIDWVRQKARSMSLLGGGAVALSGLVMVLLTDWVMQLWMGRAFPDQRLIVGLVAGMQVIVAVTSPYNMILNSMGQTRIQIVVWAAFLAVTVTAKVLLVDADALWLLPLISLAAYAVIIAPAMIVTASRIEPTKVLLR